MSGAKSKSSKKDSKKDHKQIEDVKKEPEKETKKESKKHEVRENVITQIHDVMKSYDMFVSMDDEIAERMIRRIERGCYGLAREKAIERYIMCKWSNPGFLAIYRSITFELICALNPMSDSHSAYAVELLLNGSIPPEKIGTLHPYELQPERKAEADEIIQKSLGSGSNAVRASTFYKCVCGSELTRTRNVYASRADEGVSKQVTCLKCGNSWRES